MSSPAVTPKIVQVPSIGNIQFPGDMPDDQIAAAIKKNYPQLSAPPKSGFITQPTLSEASARFRDPGGTYMTAGTGTYKPPVDPDVTKPNTLKNLITSAGIPISQGQTTQAVQGLLAPQVDPAEQDKVLRVAEQVPLIGSDFRARAALARRAGNETGTVAQVHKAAAMVPLVGPALVAAQDELDRGNYTGAAGAGLNALLSMEGLKGAVKPRLTAPEGLRPPSESAVNQPALPVKAGTYTGPPIETAGVPAKSLSKILGGGKEAMAKAPIKQQTAAGRASNLEVAQYAQQHGIDLLPGQATGARGIQTLQAEGERAIVMPGELPDVLEQQKANFGNLLDDFKTRVGTEAIPDTEAVGTSLQSQAHNGLDTLRKSAQDDYQAFQNKTGDIPVDLSDVKDKYGQKLADQAEALKNVPSEYANPVKNVLKKLSSIEAGGPADAANLKAFNDAVDTYGLGPEQQAALRTKLGLPESGSASAGVKMSTAQQLRSAYLDIARDYAGNVPKSVQRLAGEAAKDIDGAMAKAADSVGATDQWRAANAKWKQLQETYNNPQHPLYKIIQEADPSKVPTRLLGKGNYGGSPQTVRQLQQSGIDLSPLKREVAQQIAAKNFSLTNGGNGLGGFSTEFLKQLYSPAEFDELTKIGRIGRAIKFELNPSGTSNVLEGGRTLRALIRHGGPLAAGAGTGFILGGPIGALAGGVLAGAGDALVPSIASKLTTSQALRRAAMPGVDASPSLMRIIRGEEPPPELPAVSGGSTPEPQTPQRPSFLQPPEERGIKKPDRRTFERMSPSDVSDYFSYRFDQLRNEMKTAQSSGDQAVIADVQRRMNELDQIQRNPRNLMDILGGKKVDLNAPKGERVIPPDVTAKADKSGKAVGITPLGRSISGEVKNSKEFPNLGKPIPAGDAIPEHGQFAAVRTDDGQIFVDPNWQQSTHIIFMKKRGIPPDRVQDAGWIKDGVYEPSDRSDAGSYGERARALLRANEKKSGKGQPISKNQGPRSLSHILAGANA